MSSKTSQNTIHNEADNYWQRSNLVKRDFWLIPIYLIATNILVLLLVYLVTQFNVDFIELEHPIYIISSILSSVILLYIFYLMHRKHQIINIALQRFRQLKPYTMLFVSTYIASTILIYIYEWLTTFYLNRYNIVKHRTKWNCCHYLIILGCYRYYLLILLF